MGVDTVVSIIGDLTIMMVVVGTITAKVEAEDMTMVVIGVLMVTGEMNTMVAGDSSEMIADKKICIYCGPQFMEKLVNN